MTPPAETTAVARESHQGQTTATVIENETSRESSQEDDDDTSVELVVVKDDPKPATTPSRVSCPSSPATSNNGSMHSTAARLSVPSSPNIIASSTPSSPAIVSNPSNTSSPAIHTGGVSSFDEDEDDGHVAIDLTPPSSPSLRRRTLYNNNGDHRDNDDAITPPPPLQVPTSPQHEFHNEWNGVLPSLDARIGRGRQAIMNFFLTARHAQPQTQQSEQDPTDPLDYRAMQAEQDKKFVESFWKWYDDVVILSLFGFLGICFRLAAANWFKVFDDVFNHQSALFTNLPLNCLSCFLLGMLGSGNDLMEVVNTRKETRGLLNNNMQQEEQQEYNIEAEERDQDEAFGLDASSSRQGTTLRQRHHSSTQPPPTLAWIHSTSPQVAEDDEMRSVQLQALERRIRASPCLILFPVKKEEMDVMEHYFDDGRFQGRQRDVSLHDLTLTREEEDVEAQQQEEESNGNHDTVEEESVQENASTERDSEDENKDSEEQESSRVSPLEESTTDSTALSINLDTLAPQRAPRVTLRGHAPLAAASPRNNDHTVEGQQGLDQFIHGVSANIQGVSTNITSNFSRFNRINLADGWESGTTARAMSDDLLLGLRTGFCGALSSFTSWNSSMVNLLRHGRIGEAFVGYIIGIQLPIVAYRFGQHAALYLFVWRCRREVRRDERRGYGLRVRLDDDEEDEDDEFEDEGSVADGSPTAITRAGSKSPGDPDESTERDTPSIRAIATAVFVLAIMVFITSISFFNEPSQQQIAIGLLFSPFGVLTRWKLSKFNDWRPGFPVGTFAANMLACLLSGSLGTLLAGNPGPEERIVLVAMISGFAGSLSSLATFIVEILAGVDPIIFRYDGILYAIATLWWGFVIGLVTRASMDWADEI